MENRVAVISIIVENAESVEELNAILHDYRDCVIGRMGIPYREKGICLISVAVDAPQNTISMIAGRIGKLSGVSVKTAMASK